MIRNRRFASRRGATLVEFITTLPVIIAMGLGVVDVGRMLLERHSIVQGTFETARLAAMGASAVSDSEVQTYANSVLQTMGVDTTGLAVTVARGWDGAEPIVTVTVELPVTALAGFIELPATHRQQFTLVDAEV